MASAVSEQLCVDCVERGRELSWGQGRPLGARAHEINLWTSWQNLSPTRNPLNLLTLNTSGRRQGRSGQIAQ